MSEFIDHLVLTEIDDRIFEVSMLPFRYRSDVAKQIFTVPVGFRTDFSSMPRVLPILYALLGDQEHEPAVIHDWLYYSALVNRKMADDVFFEAMGVKGISRLKQYPLWWGLRIGGWPAWNKHRRDGDPQPGKFPDIITIA
jgi:hypothetical protein